MRIDCFIKMGVILLSDNSSKSILIVDNLIALFEEPNFWEKTLDLAF